MPPKFRCLHKKHTFHRVPTLSIIKRGFSLEKFKVSHWPVVMEVMKITGLAHLPSFSIPQRKHQRQKVTLRIGSCEDKESEPTCPIQCPCVAVLLVQVEPFLLDAHSLPPKGTGIKVDWFCISQCRSWPVKTHFNSSVCSLTPSTYLSAFRIVRR